MDNKIKELQMLKFRFCFSVDELMEINIIINTYNDIMELKSAIDKIIDKKIIELKIKEKKENESKC